MLYINGVLVSGNFTAAQALIILVVLFAGLVFFKNLLNVWKGK